MISVQRKTGWEQRLYAYLLAKMKEPFQWGSNDCIIFCAGAVEVITGEDFAAPYRGTYDGPLGAAKILSGLGVRGVGELLALYLPETPVSLAQRGDVILSDNPDGEEFCAICQGTSSVGPTASGMIHFKTSQAKRAFQV